MNVTEAFQYYLGKKMSNELTKTEIKDALKNKHGFSDADTVEIMKAISNEELNEIQNPNSSLSNMLNSKVVSYFFLIFGIIAIVVSIRLINSEQKTQLSTFLPWIIIAGALFILIKHIRILTKKE